MPFKSRFCQQPLKNRAADELLRRNQACLENNLFKRPAVNPPPCVAGLPPLRDETVAGTRYQK